MTNQPQAIILLLDADHIEKHNYIATQIRDISFQKQNHYLTQFCQAMGFDIFKTINVSRSGVEFDVLANNLKAENQKFVFIAEDFKRLTRQPEAFITFHNAFYQAIEEKKAYILSAHDALIIEPIKNLISDMKDFLQVVTYIVENN